MRWSATPEQENKNKNKNKNGKIDFRATPKSHGSGSATPRSASHPQWQNGKNKI
jgi:hypothetical protein